jgi:uncharacterized protein (TIGR03066 family)
MRTYRLAIVIVALALGMAHGGGEATKLTEKALVGKWSIKYIDPKAKSEDVVKKTIEFKPDGTYLWLISRQKLQGTYKLNGNTLSLTRKGAPSVTLWKDLKLQEGKLIHPVGTLGGRNELTRIE